VSYFENVQIQKKTIMATLSTPEIIARHPGKILLPAPDCPPVRLPLYSHAVRAGFPSPADDYVEGLLDLNEYLIHDRPGTLMAKMNSDAMMPNIAPGDLLVVDRGLPPQDGHIVMAEINGEFMVRMLGREYGRVALMSSNRRYRSIILADDDELIVFGVVTAVVRQLVSARR
jgi:DNA polymerase V